MRGVVWFERMQKSLWCIACIKDRDRGNEVIGAKGLSKMQMSLRLYSLRKEDGGG
jgi:hypothetical protein